MAACHLGRNFEEQKIGRVDLDVRFAYNVRMGGRSGKVSQGIVGMNVLVADTGLAPRTLQEFCDLQILKPLPATHKRGRGFHREFDATPPHFGERTWALIAAALHKLRIPFGDIKIIVDNFRFHLGTDKAPRNVDWHKWLGMSPFGKALLGRFVLLFVLLDEKRVVSWQLLFDAEKKPQLSAEDGWIMETKHGEELMALNENIELNLDPELILDRPAGYVLNLSQILGPLTSRGTKII